MSEPSNLIAENMKQHFEGTIVFEGLVEGPLGGDTEIVEKLREWVASMKSIGVSFDLDTNAGRFSLMPDDKPIFVTKLEVTMDQAMTQAMEQLIAIFPPSDQPSLYSTLRCSEYKKNEAIQTVFVVNPDGGVDVETRTATIETVETPQPIPLKERIRSAIIGLALAVIVLGVSSFFVDYKAMFGQVADKIEPTQAEDITLELGTFGEFYAVTDKKVDAKRNIFIIQLTPTALHPQTDTLWNALYEDAGNDVKKRLTIESIVRGEYKFQLFDDDGKFIGSIAHSLYQTHDGKMPLTVALQMPRKTRVGKVKLTF